MSRWLVILLHSYIIQRSLSLPPQAFELHPAGCRNSSPYDKRVNCLYHFLGSLSFRRILRSAPPITSLDINYNGKFAHHPPLRRNSLTQSLDTYILVPCNSKPRHDQARDNRISSSRVCRKLR